MITLLHGDNTVASRGELLRIKDSFAGYEIRILDGAVCDETLLTQALESSSLFTEKKVVIIEHLFGKLGRKAKRIEALAAILNRSSKNTEIILWEDKEIGKTILNALGPAVRTVSYKIPPLIFEFLDGLSPGNGVRLTQTFDALSATVAAELVFAMTVKRVRHLTMIRDGVMPEGVTGWQQSRLTTQAQHFTLEQLLMIHKNLLTAEYAVKSGSTPLTLAEHIKHIVAFM